jgi:hypothetical protein
VSPRRQPRIEIERPRSAADWTVFVAPEATRATSHSGSPNATGLWRSALREGRVSKIFDVPPLAYLRRHAEADLDDDSALLDELSEWALASSRGDHPVGWSAPAADVVSTWIDRDRLTVRSGPHIVKGELRSDGKTLAIAFPELARIGEELPDARRAWSEALCLDAQSRWHMVRFSVAGDRIGAQVDLSGAPSSVMRPLFVRAFEALIFSVGWVLPALALVTDPSAESRLLDRGPVWAQDALRDHARPEAGLQPILID